MGDPGATFERFTLGINQQRLLEHIAELLELQCQMTADLLTTQKPGTPPISIPNRPQMLHFDRHAEIEWKPGKGPRDWLGRRRKKVASSH